MADSRTANYYTDSTGYWDVTRNGFNAYNMDSNSGGFNIKPSLNYGRGGFSVSADCTTMTWINGHKSYRQGSTLKSETAVFLRVGALYLAWSGGLNTASASYTSQQWRLTKCSGAACSSSGGLGNNSLWPKTTGALVACDVVALRNVASGQVKDCAHGSCTNQNWPPTIGNWGTPYKVMKAGSVTCGAAILSGDSIWFAGMKDGKWPSSPTSWVVRADSSNVIGSTLAATNFVVNTYKTGN